MKHFRTPKRDPELAAIDRDVARALAKYFRRRAATLRNKTEVLVSDLENHLSDIAWYETKADEIEGRWA